jgi:predicted nucleotide-binding protein
MTVEAQSPPAPAAASANAAAAKLIVPKNEALRMIKAQLERGLEIKRTKLRYVPDLERAREVKGEWTTTTMTMLKAIFNNGSVADDCQAWHGKVLPEYADLNLFIEHFYDEMDQRLRKLHAVWKRVHDLPDETPKIATALAVSAANAAAATAAPSPDFFDSPTAAPAATSRAAAAASGSASNSLRPKVVAVVVYEHDPRAQTAVREFCSKLGFQVHEIQGDTDPGAGLAEKLDQHAHLDFGLILSRGQTSPKPFELGYCVGRLGLKRVFVLSATDDKLSVDEHGLLHIPLDPADGWQLHLARQLKRAGLEVDLNRVF